MLAAGEHVTRNKEEVKKTENEETVRKGWIETWIINENNSEGNGTKEWAYEFVGRRINERARLMNKKKNDRMVE